MNRNDGKEVDLFSVIGRLFVENALLKQQIADDRDSFDKAFREVTRPTDTPISEEE